MLVTTPAGVAFCTKGSTLLVITAAGLAFCTKGST
ncbi:hypothetical protein HMPREF9216_0771, partial [Lactobacillus iners LEAF 2053A-b]